MNSAKELKKSLTELGVFTVEEVDAKVAEAIKNGKVVDDLQAPAVSEELFNKALAAIDAVLKPGEVAISKSEVDAAAREVEEALASRDGLDLGQVVSLVKSHHDLMLKRFDRQDETIRAVLRAVKDMFVSTVDGVNAVAKSNASDFSALRDAVTSLGRGSVRPQVPPGRVAPQQGSAGAEFAADITKSDRGLSAVAVAKQKLYDIIKSESRNIGTSTERREQLAMASSSLHGVDSIEAVRHVANLLGVTI